MLASYSAESEGMSRPSVYNVDFGIGFQAHAAINQLKFGYIPSQGWSEPFLSQGIVVVIHRCLKEFLLQRLQSSTCATPVANTGDIIGVYEKRIYLFIVEIVDIIVTIKRRVIDFKIRHRILILKIWKPKFNTMASSKKYGRKLNPNRCLREPLGVKGERQSVVVTNNPSTIDQNQQLLVRFPNLGAHDVIVPGTAKLAFTISLKSTDDNRTVVQNLGRAVVKKKTIKISGNEVLSIDDSDVFHCYQDLWKTAQERSNSQYQGIDLSDDRNVNRIRVAAENKDETKAEDAAIAAAFGNRYHIPLDFELLESHMPFYQSALGDRLEYELTFNDYSRVVVATNDTAASYTVENIALEFDKVTQPDLASRIRSRYAGRLAVLYERVLRHRKITVNKSDTLWNINLNVPARSMKGILLLFEAPAAAFSRNTEAFYNPKITKVEVTIEGVPNQLYSQGMRAYQLWDEARKHFAAGTKRHPKVATVAKDLALGDVSLGQFLTSKYALWLDLRTTDDDELYDNGRRVENASEGVTIQISKKAEAAGKLNIYLYVIMDAQLNIENGRFVSALY